MIGSGPVSYKHRQGEGDRPQGVAGVPLCHARSVRDVRYDAERRNEVELT
jgi:hypothetical protein